MSFEPLLHILVVDNDDSVCEATTEMLEFLNYRVDAETESLNALKVFSQNPHRFDLAIIEPTLPDLTGLDLAIRFRHMRPGFPILFYAGYVGESLGGRIETENLGSVIFKPLTLTELAAAIRDRLSLGARGCAA